MNLRYSRLIAYASVVLMPVLAPCEMPPCYRDLETNFFNPALVSEALSLHSVFQSSWTLIISELQTNVKRVPDLVKARAKKMERNPFEPTFQPQEAAALLRQVLFEVFSQTLADFHITNQNNVDEMFQYIRERQSQRFLACFGDLKEERN